MAGEPDDVDTMVEPVVPSRHRWLAGLLGARPGDRVADLGCGTGGTLAQAAPAVPGGLVAGLDLSAGALARTAEAVAEAVAGQDRPPGVLLVQADLRGLPGPQDHLGRLRGRPGPRRHRGPLRPRRPHRPGAAAAPPSQGTPAGLHGRGQLDDRQPARAG